MSEQPTTDRVALVAMLRQMQCEPLSFDLHMVANAAERAADMIERLSSEPDAKDAARWRYWAALSHDEKHAFADLPEHRLLDVIDGSLSTTKAGNEPKVAAHSWRCEGSHGAERWVCDKCGKSDSRTWAPPPNGPCLSLNGAGK